MCTRYMMACAVIIWACGAAGAGEPPRKPPVTLNMIVLLKAAGLTDGELSGLINLRKGLDLTLDEKSIAVLKAAGCGEGFINWIKDYKNPPADGGTTASTPPEQTTKPLEAQPPPKEIEPPMRRKVEAPPPRTFFGPSATAEQHKATARLYAQILASSKLTAKNHAAKHITIIADDKVAKKFMPGVKKIESALERTFKGVIKKGTDPRSTYVVLAANRDEYQAWIIAMFSELKLQQLIESADDPLKMALTSGGYLTATCCVIDLSRYGDDRKRSAAIAYNIGYLYMQQLTEVNSPDYLVTGFGN